MKFFKELPTIFPFYTDIAHQNERIENRRNVCPFKLLSPENALLPFQFEINKTSPPPDRWEIVSADGFNSIDISNNLNLISVYEFTERKVAVYFGEELTFIYESINKILKLETGRYFTRFVFPDGDYLVSEIFTVPDRKFKNAESPDNLLRIDFWNDSDVNPIIYRDGWRQTIFLDTFIHIATPEIEEDVEADGNGSDVPTFQKLILKYKFSDDVPDYIKIALISLQMSDHVKLTAIGRSGEVDRVSITATPDDSGSNIVDVVFENDIIIKTACAKSETVINKENW